MTRTLPALPTPARSSLFGYEAMLFEVFECGRSSNRVRVLELSPYRAVTAAAIHLGISADKLRAQRVPNVSIHEVSDALASSGLA